MLREQVSVSDLVVPSNVRFPCGTCVSTCSRHEGSSAPLRNGHRHCSGSAHPVAQSGESHRHAAKDCRGCVYVLQ